jgi:uncharacterized membrane protein HdeD (DUF308 family)
MVIFGYKSRVNGPMRALVALAVGVMMVVYPASALTTVVKIIAAFMIASGVVSLVVGIRDKDRGALPLMSFNALVNLLLEILMFVFAPVIAKFVIYLVGFVLLAFGIVQIAAFLGARRIMPVSLGSFVLPIVVTMVGGFILFNPFAESVMTIIAGSALVLYGVSEFLSSWRMKKVKDFEDSQVDEQEAHVLETDDNIDEQ